MNLIGIDIGGTKISVCLGDEMGNFYGSKRIHTQSYGGSKKGVPATIALVHEVLEKENVHLDDIGAIGISSPGPICSKEGKMINPPNLKGWENTELVKLFTEAFHIPVFMNNDANAAAIAEFEFGSCKGVQNLVYLTCSTGMGGGIIIDGEILQGISDTAGEVGHFVLDINGPPCPCGHRGCFEVYCGGGNLAKRLQDRIALEGTKSKILEEAGGEISNIDMIALIKAVKKKGPIALEVWEEFIERLAQGIGIVLQTINPEVIVLGTIAIHTGDLLMEPLKKALPRYAWKEPMSSCKIVVSALGDKISELSGLALASQGLRKHNT